MIKLKIGLWNTEQNWQAFSWNKTKREYSNKIRNERGDILTNYGITKDHEWLLGKTICQ
jgi:hypothetical protein